MNRRAQAWVTAWNLARRWHRYEVEGLETLLGDEPYLIVGYHGRPVAHGLIMLLNEIHARKGYFPHAIAHRALFDTPIVGPMFRDLGMVAGDGPALDAAVQRGEHLVVTPGGTREACRPVWRGSTVDWGHRTGYLRLAHRLGLKIVPTAAIGEDHAFIGLNDGYRLGKRLGTPGIPLWLGVGLGGIVPFALPFPVKIRQIIGAPISVDIEGDIYADEGAAHRLHQRVSSAVQALLDRRASHAEHS
jgi:1-acyl-sn-glycerol-3-phosphate acyltransferase